MKPISIQNLTKALTLLEELFRLEHANLPATELVVCGGSALLARNLVIRTTRDVDVLARLQDGQLVDADPLPKEWLDSAKVVAKEMALPEDWLNTGPADLFKMGLPVGL